ncbi:MAG: GDCCVxC domain-containing (seleno)protein [Vicinamibacterales bacterium]
MTPAMQAGTAGMSGGWTNRWTARLAPMTVLDVTLTCPQCLRAVTESMPLDRCVFFWECPSCHAVMKPKAGDCCVYCSFGDRRCPPMQSGCSCPDSAH